MSILHRPVTCLLIGLLAYGMIIGPFSTYMKHKPIEEKLGYLPSTNVMLYSSADHKQLAGALLVMKVIMYFG